MCDRRVIGDEGSCGGHLLELVLSCSPEELGLKLCPTILEVQPF